MTERAGVTKKVSLSVHADDLKVLKARAKRMHAGNVSAVFAELIAQVKREEAWAKAVAWYGKPIVMNEDERQRIDRELLGTAREGRQRQPPSRQKRAARKRTRSKATA